MEHLSFLGAFLVMAVRLLHRFIYNSHLGVNRRETAKPDDDEGVHEGSNLLNTDADPDPQARTRKVVCSAAAAGYMAITALSAFSIDA